MNASTWAVLDDAHAALRTAVAGVTERDAPTPCSAWNVTQVLQHATGDQLGFAAAITGSGGPTEDPFAPSGVLVGDPVELVEAAMSAAAVAWSQVGPEVSDVPVPVPPGALPAAVGVGACALDAAVHAWDIAVAGGRPSPLTPELARELHPVARQIVEPLRGYGAYAPALPAEDGDDEAAALLRYLGRDPRWTPATR